MHQGHTVFQNTQHMNIFQPYLFDYRSCLADILRAFYMKESLGSAAAMDVCRIQKRSQRQGLPVGLGLEVYETTPRRSGCTCLVSRRAAGLRLVFLVSF